MPTIDSMQMRTHAPRRRPTLVGASDVLNLRTA